MHEDRVVFAPHAHLGLILQYDVLEGHRVLPVSGHRDAGVEALDLHRLDQPRSWPVPVHRQAGAARSGRRADQHVLDRASVIGDEVDAGGARVAAADVDGEVRDAVAEGLVAASALIAAAAVHLRAGGHHIARIGCIGVALAGVLELKYRLGSALADQQEAGAPAEAPTLEVFVLAALDRRADQIGAGR